MKNLWEDERVFTCSTSHGNFETTSRNVAKMSCHWNLKCAEISGEYKKCRVNSNWEDWAGRETNLRVWAFYKETNGLFCEDIRTKPISSSLKDAWPIFVVLIRRLHVIHLNLVGFTYMTQIRNIFLNSSYLFISQLLFFIIFTLIL